MALAVSRGASAVPGLLLVVAMALTACQADDQADDGGRRTAPPRDETAAPDGAGGRGAARPRRPPPDDLRPGGHGPPGDVVLAWTRGALPDAVVAAVGDHPAVGAVTTVRVATVGLVRTRTAAGEVVDEVDDGWRLPVEVLAVDPEGYAAVTGLEAAAGLEAGEALLSATSARVRELDAGGSLTLADGRVLEVAGIAADELVGAGEVVVPSDAAPAGAEPRYLLARPAERGEDVVDALREALPATPPIRLRTPGETPVLRHADAVTAPVRRKAAFGEFAIRDAAGRSVEQAPGWIEEHVVTTSVPLVGEVTCHREAVGPLREAMRTLVDAGEAHVVDAEGYAGCWNPRTQSVGRPLSSHAWGIAVDLNAGELAQGSDAEPPPALVEAMADAGFTNGAGWLRPDPMHFELVPDREAP